VITENKQNKTKKESEVNSMSESREKENAHHNTVFKDGRQVRTFKYLSNIKNNFRNFRL
jgi:hypothetical protein